MPTPRKEINADHVRKLAQVGCTDAEIAFCFDCSEQTIRRRFAAELKRGRARLKIALRHAQIKAARKGNNAMMIWLGKQYLDQKDRQEVEQHGGTLRVVEEIQPDAGTGGDTADGPDHGEADSPAA